LACFAAKGKFYQHFLATEQKFHSPVGTCRKKLISDSGVWTQLTLLRVMTLLEATAAKARSLGLLQTNNNKH